MVQVAPKTIEIPQFVHTAVDVPVALHVLWMCLSLCNDRCLV